MNIPFSMPDVGNLEIEAMAEVVRSGWLTKGQKVVELEDRIASRLDVGGCVCVDSCTGALATVLRLLSIGPGDEVITTPYTYTATAAVIHHVGAKIVFCDLAKDSLEMDYGKLPDLITERTKAIIPVDIGGKLCDYNAIYDAIFAKKELFKPNSVMQEAMGRMAVIADAAHSFSACQSDAASGELADFTCFSFHVLKVITTGGEGGAIVWHPIEGVNNGQIKYTLKLLADAGQTSRGEGKLDNGWEYDVALLGHNHIMTNVDAAMGMAQLDRLEGMAQRRIIATLRYRKGLKGVARMMIEHLPKDKSYQSAMHLMLVEIPGGEERRNAVYREMDKAGIKCNVHYKPLPMFTAYKSLGYDIKDFPEAVGAFQKVLSLPYHSRLRRDEIEYICDTLKSVLQKV